MNDVSVGKFQLEKQICIQLSELFIFRRQYDGINLIVKVAQLSFRRVNFP
jgi:hypothetical protein